jgi:hypothetical protein
MKVGSGVNCRYRKECARQDCVFAHPEGWKRPCRDGEGCSRANCSFTHPKGWKRPCRDGGACSRTNCVFSHPETRDDPEPEPAVRGPCRDGAACARGDCVFSHPEGRLVPEPDPGTERRCRHGIECFRKGCVFDHPSGWNPDVPTPPPCRDGAGCRAKNCRFAHPPGCRLRGKRSGEGGGHGGYLGAAAEAAPAKELATVSWPESIELAEKLHKEAISKHRQLRFRVEDPEGVWTIRSDLHPCFVGQPNLIENGTMGALRLLRPQTTTSPSHSNWTKEPPVLGDRSVSPGAQSPAVPSQSRSSSR